MMHTYDVRVQGKPWGQSYEVHVEGQLGQFEGTCTEAQIDARQCSRADYISTYPRGSNETKEHFDDRVARALAPRVIPPGEKAGWAACVRRPDAAQPPICYMFPGFVNVPIGLSVPAALFKSRKPIPIFFTNKTLPGGKDSEQLILNAYVNASRAATEARWRADRTGFLAVNGDIVMQPYEPKPKTDQEYQALKKRRPNVAWPVWNPGSIASWIDPYVDNASVNQFIAMNTKGWSPQTGLIPTGTNTKAFDTSFADLRLSTKPTNDELNKPGGMKKFLARGGFLLWVDQKRSTIQGRQPITTIIPLTVDASGNEIKVDTDDYFWGVFVKRDAKGLGFQYTIERLPKGSWKQITDWLENRVEDVKSALNWVCDFFVSDEGTAVTAISSAYPPALAVTGATNAACRLRPSKTVVPDTTPGTTPPPPPTAEVLWYKKPLTIAAIGLGVLAAGGSILLLQNKHKRLSA